MPRRTTGSRIEATQPTAQTPRRTAPPALSPGSARSRRAVGYLRRSTDRQEQSIGDQKKAVERHASEHGLTLLRCYVDDAISGTSTAGRKAFLALVQDAASPTCDFATVIVYDVKRFGRIDNDEAGYYRHLFRQNGVEIRYASEGFAGDASDDLLRPVKQWQARQESKDLAKVAIRGLVSKALRGSLNGSSKGAQSAVDARKSKAPVDPARGAWMGGAPPFGFDLRYESQAGEFILVLRYQRDGSKLLLNQKGKVTRRLGRDESVAVSKRDRAKLIPGELARVEAVRTIFRLYVEERRGIKAVADELNRRKIETARASGWSDRYSGLWAAATVRVILVNPAYRGDLVWNRRTDARFFRITGDGGAVERVGSRGRRLENNDPKDWIETRDSHPSIVSRRVWELAQQILHGKPSSKEQRGKPKKARPCEMIGAAWVGPKARFLLSSLCECSKCGSRYEGHGAPTGKHVAGTPRPKTWSYACGGYIRRGRSTCSRGGVPMETLDESVVAAVLRYYDRFAGTSGAASLERTIQRQIGGESDSVERSRSRLATQREKLDGLVRNLVDNLTDTNRDHVDRRLSELTKQRELLERDLRSLDHMAIGQTAIADLKDEVKSFLVTLPETLGNGRPELRRAALQRCIEQVVIEREKRAATVMVRCIPAIAGGPRGGAVEAVEVKLKGLGK